MDSSIVKIVTVYLFYLFSLSKCDVVINTNKGKIEGKEIRSIFKNEKYYSFLGIPYANPPVRRLRFMPPEPHSGWENVLEAKKEKIHCAQYNTFVRNKVYKGYSGNEDCLYLNIHTPKLPQNDVSELPVIVFLHNNHYKVSYNYSKYYGPDFFMAEDVILVTVNHRLGPLGFLSFEDDLLPGNNGLRDIILALKWLKENIGSFGGNTDKITLMGSEAGASLVDILLHSPKAKGLFSAVIMHSGTSWSSLNFVGKAREKAIDFAKGMKEEATTSSFLLKRLANVPAQKLTESELFAVRIDEPRSLQRPVPSFSPVIEHEHPDAIISKFPEENPIDIDIPVMIGYNSAEGIDMAERYLLRPNFLTFAEKDFIVSFPKRVNYRFKLNTHVYTEIVKKIKEFYFDDGYVKVSQPGEYINYLGDIFTVYPIDYTVRKYSNESKSSVYYYMFDYSGDFNLVKNEILENALNPDGIWGATKEDELCYLFICQPIRALYKKALNDENSEEIKVLRNMVKLWTNFAKFRNPTPEPSDFTWKPATRENKACLVISDELQMKSNLHEERIRFWDEFIEEYQRKAINGVVDDIKDEL